ncbi:SDR family oxidoreductase [Roseibium sp. RKSG952]|nr:SDR family oxidoreductase [Roseibium sp. RKSG952]
MVLPQIPSLSLTGKSALVTGASSGIGLASAVALAGAGAEVVLSARRQDKLLELADAISAGGRPTRALPMDVSDIEATRETIERVGPFDILVNSAGHARHTKAVDTTPDDFDAVMRVNLRGAYFLTQTVARGLLQAGRPGSLINVSSQMGLVGGVDRAVYCASKFALEGFTKAMALEFGPAGIRINTICPTFIRTPLTEPTFQDPEKRAWVESKIKLGRVGEVSDIMGGVVYLASDASSLVTGTSLVIDGGWTAD